MVIANSRMKGDEDVVFAIDRDPVSAAWLALGGAAQGCEFALIGGCAVRLDIEGPRRR
jgi:hypothetical protein